MTLIFSSPLRRVWEARRKVACWHAGHRTHTQSGGEGTEGGGPFRALAEVLASVHGVTYGWISDIIHDMASTCEHLHRRVCTHAHTNK